MRDRAVEGWPHWHWVAGLAGVAVAAQLWGLYLLTGPPGPDWFPNADKLQHALGFALPVALLLLALGLRRLAQGRLPSRRALMTVAGGFLAHAVLSEVVQHLFYSSRTGDPWDVLADGIGVAAGALVGVALLRRATRGVDLRRPSVPEHLAAGHS
jgi:VanZ family protein